MVFLGLRFCLLGQKSNKRERKTTTVLKGTGRVGDRVGAVKQGTLGEEMEVRSNGYTATQMLCVGGSCLLRRHCALDTWTECGLNPSGFRFP